MKGLRTNGSNLKSNLRKIGYILHAETIQSTCVQSSSINYHTVIQNGKWKLATKRKEKCFTHRRLDIYFLITLKNDYYQKFINIHFFPVHTVFYPFYMIFFTFLFQGLFHLAFCMGLYVGKNPKPLNRGKTELQCHKNRLVKDLKLFQHLCQSLFSSNLFSFPFHFHEVSLWVTSP